MTDVNETMKRALEGVLAHEEKRAKYQGLTGCACINHSAQAERDYEMGRCPHQLGRAALAQAREAQETWRDISSAPKDGRWTLLKKKEPMEQRPWLLRWGWGNDLWTEDGRSGWGDYLFDAWTPAPQLPQPPRAPNAHL